MLSNNNCLSSRNQCSDLVGKILVHNLQNTNPSFPECSNTILLGGILLETQGWDFHIQRNDLQDNTQWRNLRYTNPSFLECWNIILQDGSLLEIQGLDFRNLHNEFLDNTH